MVANIAFISDWAFHKTRRGWLQKHNIIHAAISFEVEHLKLGKWSWKMYRPRGWIMQKLQFHGVVILLYPKKCLSTWKQQLFALTTHQQSMILITDHKKSPKCAWWSRWTYFIPKKHIFYFEVSLINSWTNHEFLSCPHVKSLHSSTNCSY